MKQKAWLIEFEGAKALMSDARLRKDADQYFDHRDERMKAFRSNFARPVANVNPVGKHFAIDQVLYRQSKALYVCHSLPGAQSGISIVQL